MATRTVSEPAAKTPDAGSDRPTPAAATAFPNSLRDTPAPVFAAILTSSPAPGRHMLPRVRSRSGEREHAQGWTGLGLDGGERRFIAPRRPTGADPASPGTSGP